MIDFWIGASLLLLAALAFLLIPLWRGRRAQAEQDRTALNVALYQERLSELQAQREMGALDAGQLEIAQAEAGRELLEDTESARERPDTSLGRTIPLLAILLVPVLAIGLYLHWGASDQLELAREFARQPSSMAEMTVRLERAVQLQPNSAEGWYLLGRTYMAQERPADAARAFEQVVKLSGRQPELLGQWAQALYFAEGRQWTEKLQVLADEALQGNPNEPTTLGLLGIVAFEAERFEAAADYWQRLVSSLPEQDPSRAAIQSGINQARARQALPGATATDSASVAAQLRIRVSLAASLGKRVKPDDSVFVFAQAASGPAMPLAVKRLKVADLPAVVTLGDGDAMMAQLKLSDFQQVRLTARISRSGDATKGEWKGESEPLAVSGQLVQLSIDQPDKQP
ncbi:c-type cytochrome biogenesis protein CcmI [Azomonas macrocytogenes]|uniref:Cytochrome c-type biogenesis protein CcmH n=1 Tax=Azomonas macrocytogenes TaxID=69962 RepID=A0A839SYM5_AZOMA|nr:c-type cytochrome biogenesis protein CcmI [Azomonas macrocytogenes]MBB3101799.1 cytochrome c-type biogenesis protein CcmH [Azomonas macrocytogenes]